MRVLNRLLSVRRLGLGGPEKADNPIAGRKAT